MKPTELYKLRHGMFDALDMLLSMKSESTGYDYRHPYGFYVTEIAWASVFIAPDATQFAEWLTEWFKAMDKFPTIVDLRHTFDRTTREWHRKQVESAPVSAIALFWYNRPLKNKMA